MVFVIDRNAEIVDALISHALLLETTGPEIAVAVPDPAEAFEQPTDTNDEPLPWVDVQPLLNRSKGEGLRDGGIEQGMMMLNLNMPLGRGEIEPMNIAGQIIAHFAKGTRLTSGATTVMVDKAPWVAPPIPGAGGRKFPITVYWVRVA